MSNFKLALITIVKSIFFGISYPIGWIIMILEILFNLITFIKFDTHWTDNYSEGCIWVLKKCLGAELRILNKRRQKDKQNN